MKHSENRLKEQIRRECAAMGVNTSACSRKRWLADCTKRGSRAAGFASRIPALYFAGFNVSVKNQRVARTASPRGIFLQRTSFEEVKNIPVRRILRALG